MNYAHAVLYSDLTKCGDTTTYSLFTFNQLTSSGLAPLNYALGTYLTKI